MSEDIFSVVVLVVTLIAFCGVAEIVDRIFGFKEKK